jgi:prepilin-type N-terminal cleavage/methylation domain-containing protein/prepilin-type processing-associated H-X9-DG protein
MTRRIRLRAFTLIELLVVVAIIALLIAILLPSLGRARAQAYKVRCASNLRSLSMLDLQYAYDYNGYVSRNSGGTVPSVFNLLATMQKITLTAGPLIGGFESQYKDAYARIKWLNCPAWPNSSQPICFVTNGFDPNNIGTEIDYMRVSWIKRQQETVNFADGNINLPVDNFEVYDVWQSGHLLPNASTAITGGSTVGRILSDERHRGLINLSYYDGHVDAKPYKNVAVSDFAN